MDQEGGGDHGSRQRQEVAGLHARLPSTRRRFDEALARTEEFLAAGPAYVSWSGGKDSTVVSHLATTVEPTVVLAHFDTGFDFPETIQHQDDLANKRGWDLRRYRCGNALDEMIRTGDWDHQAPDLTCDGADSEWLEVTRLGPARMAAEDTGATGHLWGLRASEAKRRLALLASTRGTHTRKDGWRWCSPIWDWKDVDVYAYHAAHDLPLSKLYDRLAEVGCPERDRRTSLMIDSGSLNLGRAVWLKRGWPDLWAQLVVALPRLREDA